MTFERSPTEEEHSLMVPYAILHDRLGYDVDTQQHKRRQAQPSRKNHIRNYRHATTRWGAALESFSPMWFAVCISSGGLALIIHGPFPYQAHWQVSRHHHQRYVAKLLTKVKVTIATILYVVELVLFFLFLAIMIVRWIVYPHVAVRKALNDPDELGAYAIPPIALMTIAALTAQQVSTGPWGGHAFTIVAYVCWWIGMFWVFLTALVVLSTFFYTGNMVDRVMTPVLFMAPVGLATAGAEAGFIPWHSYQMSARLAVPMIIVGYFALGLFASGWTVAAKRPGLVILIGPCGQLSTALMTLGQAASTYMNFAKYKPSSYQPPTYGTFWTQETAQGIQGAGLLFALLFMGFAYLWAALAVIGVMDAVIKKQTTYTLTWWSVVFPTVTLTTAWLNLSNAMDSPAFRALVCALTVLLFIAYFANLGFTLLGLFKGTLIFGPTHAEVEDDMLKKAQEREKKKLRDV
ncbi:hypothetical protein DOTSEDRAFT_31619 [Dothistroma septosporum NZE10]|uniref:C4-dicarboxylate transporter/malic acid transport protein n=1 Tax=Dothistroma septosporum (strain NZE10 / CBS 128990) TaxID=675120 RepID=N1PW25_DOTSN|nr:hypothetical protein DOTSEDRAFT_31619 [Dothistroma septosporum NZE10]